MFIKWKQFPSLTAYHPKREERQGWGATLIPWVPVDVGYVTFNVLWLLKRKGKQRGMRGSPSCHQSNTSRCLKSERFDNEPSVFGVRSMTVTAMWELNLGEEKKASANFRCWCNQHIRKWEGWRAKAGVRKPAGRRQTAFCSNEFVQVSNVTVKEKGAFAFGKRCEWRAEWVFHSRSLSTQPDINHVVVHLTHLAMT